MSIAEVQLETWAKPGAQVQSANTYQAIKKVIESNDAPYSGRSMSSYLQGSYGNDTNVFGLESDVDIVLQCSSIYYPDLQLLPPDQKEHYDRVHVSAEYNYATLKTEVVGWLQAKFPGDCDPGKKAIRIKAGGGRRDADVLPCCNYRRYRSFKGHEDAKYTEGICFIVDGKLIGNFPKQHKANCVTKQAETNNNFKAMVRIIKNMRNRMTGDGLVPAGIAPSYYVEGLLWNVPSNLYAGTYANMFHAIYNFIQNGDTTKFVCANHQEWLLRSGEVTCWEPANFKTFFDALGEFWDAGV
jgi:hypothetical protein